MWGVEFLANYTVKQIQAQTLLMNHEVALNVQIVHHRFVTSNECPWWNHQVTHLMDSALQKFNSFRAFHWRKLKQDCSPGLFGKFSCPIRFALFWCCMQYRWFDRHIGMNFRAKNWKLTLTFLANQVWDDWRKIELFCVDGAFD